MEGGGLQCRRCSGGRARGGERERNRGSGGGGWVGQGQGESDLARGVLGGTGQKASAVWRGGVREETEERDEQDELDEHC